jgi:hypothetical protein
MNNVIEIPQNFTLQQVAPQQLHSVWDMVEDDIESCRTNDPDDTWIQDVYCAIKTGQATLYLGMVNNAYIGMTVCNVVTDPFSGRRTFNIWYLNCRQGIDFLNMALPTLESYARATGAEKVSFVATRDGFRRWAEPLGFELAELKLVKELY